MDANGAPDGASDGGEDAVPEGLIRPDYDCDDPASLFITVEGDGEPLRLTGGCPGVGNEYPLGGAVGGDGWTDPGMAYVACAPGEQPAIVLGTSDSREVNAETGVMYIDRAGQRRTAFFSGKLTRMRPDGDTQQQILEGYYSARVGDLDLQGEFRVCELRPPWGHPEGRRYWLLRLKSRFGMNGEDLFR